MSMKLTHRDLVRAAFDHKETPYLPCSMLIEPPLQQRVDRELGTDWHKKITNSLFMVGGFDTWDTMRPYKDGLTIDAYGSVWQQTQDIAELRVPVLTTMELEDYTFPTLKDFMNEEKWQANLDLIASRPDEYVVGNIGAGIYELTWRLLGVEDTLVDMIADPEKITFIFDKLTELLYQFVEKVCQLPVEAVIVHDDWCDQRGVIFGKPRWEDMIRSYYKELFELIHRHGKKVILHVCGNVSPVIPELIDIGLDVLESVQPEPAGMDPLLLKQQYGKDLAFWGGLGCQQAVTFFTPDQLRDEIVRLAEGMSKGGGYVMAPAKTLNESIPTENLMVLLDTFRRYAL